MRGARRILGTALAAGALLAGCGGDGDETTTTAAPAEPEAPEKPERVAGLPRGWTVERNAAQGFSLGVPPGWRKGGACLESKAPEVPVTILCSPDKLVTLSISADRTGEALELDPGEFAVRAMAGLADSYEGLEPGEPKPFRARYEGASVKGTAKAFGTGVRQRVTVVVLRRDDVANFTAVIAANADQPTGPAVRLAEQALGTLRSQPVGPPGG